MLVKFIVENFLSFKDETTLDMLASTDSRNQNHISKNRIGNTDLEVLKSAAIYGANASGKSNLIEALMFAKNFITLGTRAEETIFTNPFKLDPVKAKSPSKFEFIIFFEGIIYHYGFSIDKQKVHEEWLLMKDNKKFKTLFERVVFENEEQSFEFGPSFVSKRKKNDYQFLEFVMRGTRSNELFLTEAFEKKVEKIKPLMKWFREILTIVSADSEYGLLEMRTKEDENFRCFLEELLILNGTGISSIGTETSKLEIEKEFNELPKSMKKLIQENINKEVGMTITGGVNLTISDEGEVIQVKTQHLTSDNETINFDFEEESEGTQRLVHLAPALFELQTSNKVYFIDELERKLHPKLSKNLVETFLKVGNERSQLLFTTHESNLLDLDLLRRDEIWFVEKDKLGSSHLTSLAEFKIRLDLNIQKGYLNGRFGAIPFIGNSEKLLME